MVPDRNGTISRPTIERRRITPVIPIALRVDVHHFCYSSESSFQNVPANGLYNGPHPITSKSCSMSSALPRFKSFGLRNITCASIFLSMLLASSSASSTDSIAALCASSPRLLWIAMTPRRSASKRYHAKFSFPPCRCPEATSRGRSARANVQKVVDERVKQSSRKEGAIS